MPQVYKWNIDLMRSEEDVIDCNSMIEVADWAKNYCTNRLPNDVGLALERAVIGTYQIAYIPDYFNMKSESAKNVYMAEALSSTLFHCIGSYEMLGKEFIALDHIYKQSLYKWKTLCNVRFFNMQSHCTDEVLVGKIALQALKYLRYHLYLHMGRKKRFNDADFETTFRELVRLCVIFSKMNNIDLSYGFELTMSKLQDSEIKRH